MKTKLIIAKLALALAFIAGPSACVSDYDDAELNDDIGASAEALLSADEANSRDTAEPGEEAVLETPNAPSGNLICGGKCRYWESSKDFNDGKPSVHTEDCADHGSSCGCPAVTPYISFGTCYIKRKVDEKNGADLDGDV